LIEATGLSARQVARLTNRLYGAPPKLLARKYRALRVASLIATTEEDWRDTIGDAFYDQSHFIRELKHFVGATPHQIKNKLSIVPRLTMSRRRLEGRFSYISRIS
jgi:methylphosphotriester-DNA--protein-cysteine methyltransferase